MHYYDLFYILYYPDTKESIYSNTVYCSDAPCTDEDLKLFLGRRNPDASVTLYVPVGETDKDKFEQWASRFLGS